tara:strand:- start:864 stop:1265 length:402 start_codon:yes stop_codon:yes gene_type:complete
MATSKKQSKENNMSEEDEIVPLDDPISIQAQRNLEEVMQSLSDIGQDMEKARKVYEHENTSWWDGLTETEREDAFYAVCKRLYQGEIEEHGSYRYVLYDVFGFGPGMYVQGMSCGFMGLHNSICINDEDKQSH